MPLAYGAYEGNMTPGDVDWFVFPPVSNASCLSASALSAHAMRVGLGAGPGASLVAGLEDGVFGTVLAIEPVPTRVGMLPDEAPWNLVSVGPYAFEMSAAPAPVAGDTKHEDATRFPALAEPIPGACFSAYFEEDDDDGDRDVWTFEANVSEHAVVSLAVGPRAGGELRVRSMDGTLVAGPIASGELAEFTVPATGRYWLVADGDGKGEAYTVATVIGPDPTGCRPYCLL